MLGAMNFWMGIVLYAMYKSYNLCPDTKNIKTMESTKQEPSGCNNPNNKPKKKWKFNDTVLHAFEVAKNFVLSGKKPTSTIINKLLGTKITDKDLFNLINGPKHVFEDLTDHKKVIATLRKLGKQNNTFSGIYIWTHIPSGSKYVGSANHLPTRLSYYFKKIVASRIVGKFLPLLKSSPITDFTLEVIFTPSSSDYRSEMILEQYFLLLPAQEGPFDLNTIRVSNNPSGSAAKPLFMYNRDGSICYYKSTKQVDFVRTLGIHKVTFMKHLEQGTYYLNKYLFSMEKLPNAEQSDITVEQVATMLDIDRVTNNKNKTLVPFSVAVTLINIETKEEHKFPSLGSAVKFLKNASYPADQRTLVKRINTNIPYHGFTCHKY